MKSIATASSNGNGKNPMRIRTPTMASAPYFNLLTSTQDLKLETSKIFDLQS